MGNPVLKHIDLRDLENLISYSKRCAEDLTAQIEMSYPGDHPVTVRRRNRELSDAKWLLSAIPALAIKYDIKTE